MTGADGMRGVVFRQGEALEPFLLEGLRLTHGLRNLDGPSEGSIILGAGAGEIRVWESDKGKLGLTAGDTVGNTTGDSKLSRPLTPKGTPGTEGVPMAGWIS